MVDILVHAYTHICLASYENICIETMYYSTKCLRCNYRYIVVQPPFTKAYSQVWL